MERLIKERLIERMLVLDGLAESLSCKQFKQNIDLPKYKTAEDHFWCLAGARESYLKAILQGEWQGFHCSIANDAQQKDYVTLLKQFTTKFSQLFEITTIDDQRKQLLLDCYEHELLHEAQLIRLMYALELEMPIESRWA